MELLIEFLKFLSTLAWPVMVFAVFWMFREQIAAAIPNVTEAGPTGVKLGQQVSKAISTYAAKGELKQLPKSAARTPLITKVETNLHEILRDYKETEQVDLLVHELAVARLVAACEAVWGSIYQSQINALLMMKNGGGDAPISNLRMLFDAQKYPDTYTFDEWVHYLAATDLIGSDGERVALTEFGDDFTAWLSTKSGLSRAP